MRCVLLVACLAISFHMVSAGFVHVVYTTTMSGAQVVPGPGEDAYATAVCVYGRYVTPVTLDCEVQHNITDILSLGVYNGTAGNTGDLQFAFSDVTQGRNLRQVFEFPSTDLQDDFLFGRMFLQINSNEFPGGSIRGQLLQNDRAYAKMTAEQTIPPSTGTTSEGIALATYEFANPERWLSIDVVHDVVRPTGIELREGESNQVGSLVSTFDEFTSPAFDNVQLTQHEGERLVEDLLFLNIRSEQNPDGDIRGQLITIDYIGVAAFTAHLTGGKVVPPVDTDHSGCAIVTYDCENDVMDYVIFHSLNNANAAFLGIGDENDGGVLIAGLSTGASPIYGSIKLSDEESFQLYSSNMFVTVTVGEGTPVIRGQLSTDHSYWAYLSGTNEVGPVTTAYHGCGILRLNSELTAFEFEVHHNVPNPVLAGFFGGAEGEAGRLRFEIDNLNVEIDGDDELSPWSGEFELDDDDLQALLQERLYFNIETLEHPNGVIRGNFKKLNPCNDDDDEGFPSSGSYNVASYFSAFYSPTYSADIQIDDSASALKLSIAAMAVVVAALIL
mmetsp:Transcript_4558/g.16035  ORF Transcript_4558/g.16035 Transcript_4558/m.16035 type:complete len:557 (+) Transcript_4558:115-1785(+)